ncbi:MAG TPA: alkaline phosphatase family protein [Gaiellaceae bacterium]|nr:alkaline phosphatase family protein [Gaiellaceae bacterium]
MYENHGWDEIVGNPDAPTFNSLATQYGQMTNYDAVTHPSLPNYLAVVSGSTHGITTDCTTCVVNAKNLADSLDKAHKTWKTYAEDLPSAGAMGSFYGGTNGYVKRHDPFMYFKDIRSSRKRRAHIVPFTRLAHDVAHNQLPAFSLVIPNLMDDMHNGTVAQGDAWLNANIVPLLSSPALGSNGVVFVVFDEAESTDKTGGGGHVDVLALGPAVKPGSVFSGLTNHYGLLRTIEDAWHLPRLAHSATATPITGIWKG